MRLSRSTAFGLITAALLLVLLLCFLAGGVLATLGSVLVILASIIAIFRPTFIQLGLGCAVGSAFTAPWNAVLVAHVRPSDALLLLGLVCFTLAGLPAGWWKLPPWLVQLAAVIVVLAVFHQLDPTSRSYLDSRVIVNAVGQVEPETFTNLGTAFKWLVSVLGVPYLIRLAHHHRRRSAYWLGAAYILGVAVSSLVAFAASYGLTIPSAFYVPGSAGREAGLAVQPNHLAATCTMAAPICLWFLVQARRRAVALGAGCLLFVVIGDYETGSRGGVVAVALALGLAVVALPQLRRQILQLSLALLAIACAVLVAVPSLLKKVADATRLGGHQASVTGSDTVRHILANQGHKDFAHSPVTGVGLQVAVEAHNIYLQLMAAGGIILLISMMLFAAGALVAAVRSLGSDYYSAAMGIAVIGWLAFGAVENSLTDRYLYVPVAIIVALSYPITAPRATADDVPLIEPVGVPAPVRRRAPVLEPLTD